MATTDERTDPGAIDEVDAAADAGADALDRPAVSRGQARLAGALAAAVALGVGELVSSFGGVEQSLIAGVGNEFIDRFAGPLKDVAIAVFGTSDKAALLVGIVVVALLIGAALGRASVRRPWVGVVGFAAFGVLGAVAGILDDQADAGLAIAAAAAAAVAGVGTLVLLLRVAASRTGVPIATTRTIESPTDPAATRRAFFGWSAAAGAFAVGVAALGRAMAGASKAELAREATVLPAPTNVDPGTLGPGGTLLADEATTIPGLTPYFVPNKDFYRIDTALIVPEVDPATWAISIAGMVDRPFDIGYAELLAMDQIEEAVTLSCVSNNVGGELVGNARWQGIPLATLLDRAGVQPGATQLVAESVDGWTGGFPTELVYDGRVAMLAVGMNGEPLPIPHGFPARLVIEGLYGYVSATKWLREIRLTTWEGEDGYWIDKGWAKEGPVKTQSRIDVPKFSLEHPAGPTKIAGVAWAPNRGISKVEVQVDGGEWHEARLADVVSDGTWVQWVTDWDAPPGEHQIQVRATDGTGETQPEVRTAVAPDGATGWHSRTLTVV
jgi:DMSO/TMAO reductase YedYZ molybdopterin-dependent catalytic subunit